MKIVSSPYKTASGSFRSYWQRGDEVLLVAPVVSGFLHLLSSCLQDEQHRCLLQLGLP